ncbi:histone-lysine N-methyltransferase SETMAR [Trichonephila inaurata madagascariensis]|uniref:Histone-lysine N-methyltransferase SETMAR n=1 Tax=Trichonephila inaurata madagascariensis TaxID=2747483 RepID=A0A8X6Y0N0_9ARAC|nr:histone-lysine N-methyltransferase SETMAR [Trichonephila inaurata madagascariensis]
MILIGETLRSLRKSIKNKKQRLLTEGVVLLHDNAHLQGTHAELSFIWEQLDHPSYSPNMSPCDFHVLDPLKKDLKGKHFNSDDELKDAVKDMVIGIPGKRNPSTL